MTAHGLPRYLAEVLPEVADALAGTEGIERVAYRKIFCSAVGLLNLKQRDTLFFANGGDGVTGPVGRRR